MVAMLNHETDSGARMWTDYLVKELEICRTTLEERGANVEDLAAGVACFCADTDAQSMDSRYVDALLGRALWSVGHVDEARRFLSTRMAPRKETLDTLLHVMALGDVSPLLWAAIVRGVIRRTRWVTHGSMWVLDLAQLATASEAMELTELTMARSLMSVLAVVWTPTNGHGALGIAPRGLPAQKTLDLFAWPVYCEQVLAREQRVRGWATRPEVVRLSVC